MYVNKSSLRYVIESFSAEWVLREAANVLSGHIIQDNIVTSPTLSHLAHVAEA